MSEPPLQCPQCGAALGAADLQAKACRYCGTMHPHVARAAEKVEIVKQMMTPGPGGVPPALQGMMAPYAGMMPNYGMPPQPPLGYPPGAPPGPGAVPPQFGAPIGQPGPMMPFYGAPAMDAAQQIRSGVRTVIIVVTAVTLLLVLGGAALAVFLTAR